MKKLILVCLMAFVGLGVCSAQKQGEKKGATTVVFATDLDCEGCVNKIMANVPSLGKGVKDVTADVKTKEVTVVFDASKNNAEHIIKGLQSLNVNATVKSVDGQAATCCKADGCAAQKECKDGACTAEQKCCGGEKCTDHKCCESEKAGEHKCCKGEKAGEHKCCEGDTCAAKK